MKTNNKQISTAQPMNVSSNSPAVPLKNVYLYSMAAIVTGTPTGTIKLQASNDPETNSTMPGGIPQPLPINWVDIANSSFSLSAAGETMWNVTDVAYNYVRVVYTDSSSGASTATMNIIVNTKEFN